MKIRKDNKKTEPISNQIMAKDTTILFVYDTELLRNEEDDPNSAVLYFYPSWVTEQQKTALCGQLMGTIICLKGLFSIPKFVSIQTGKFRIIENGRYILALGTDKNISENILEYRINVIWSLLVFYHKDIENLANMHSFYTLKSKLSAIFDALLKILFIGANLSCNHQMTASTQELEKNNRSSSEINAVTASDFLDKCRKLSNVFGGVVSYQNKIIATQLSVPTTKNMILSNPIQIKYAAERIQIGFKLPKEVQLFEVYITNEEYLEILESRYFSYQHFFKKGKKNNYKVNHIDHRSHNSHHILYATVPEEDNDNIKSTLLNNHVSSRPNSLLLNNCIKNQCTTRLETATTPMTEYKAFLPNKNIGLRNQDGYNDLLRKSNSNNNNNNRQYSTTSKMKISSDLTRSRSIHDPCYPFFKSNGNAASKFYLSQQFTFSVRSLPIDIDKKQNRKKANRKTINLKSPLHSCFNHSKQTERGNSELPLLMDKLNIKVEEDLQKCILFVGTRKRANISLLLHIECSNDRELILQLWELCQEYLPQLEAQYKTMELPLNNSSTVQSSQTSLVRSSSSCSLIRMDSHRDKIEKDGQWGDESDENFLFDLHANIQDRHDLSEVLLRKPESLVYAYPEGDVAEFYRIETLPTNGLPDLNDPMTSLASHIKSKHQFKWAK